MWCAGRMMITTGPSLECHQNWKSGASLGHDDRGVLIFSRRKFTIYQTDEFPTSRILTKSSSQKQERRDLPDKGNTPELQMTIHSIFPQGKPWISIICMIESDRIQTSPPAAWLTTNCVNNASNSSYCISDSSNKPNISNVNANSSWNQIDENIYLMIKIVTMVVQRHLNICDI